MTYAWENYKLTRDERDALIEKITDPHEMLLALVKDSITGGPVEGERYQMVNFSNNVWAKAVALATTPAADYAGIEARVLAHMVADAKPSPVTQNIYQAMIAAGCEIDHHETDLYVKVSPVSQEIVDRYKAADICSAKNAVKFRADDGSGQWFDIPFAYEPSWPTPRKNVPRA